MPYSWNRLRRPLNFALVAGSILYPGMVYVGQSRISPLTFVAIILALIGLRLAFADRDASALLRFPIAVAAIGVAVLALLDDELAVRAYPVFVSFGIAALFAHSLYKPPSLIERAARLREPDLKPEAALYCWRVTLVWTLFALFNGGIAWGTAVWGTLQVWTLWNGLVSYILMGVLSVGELMVRSVVRRKWA